MREFHQILIVNALHTPGRIAVASGQSEQTVGRLEHHS